MLVEHHRGLNDQTDRILISIKFQDSRVVQEEQGKPWANSRNSRTGFVCSNQLYPSPGFNSFVYEAHIENQMFITIFWRWGRELGKVLINNLWMAGAGEPVLNPAVNSASAQCFSCLQAQSLPVGN